MITRIELAQKEQYHDAEGKAILAGARDLGVAGLTAVHAFRVYYFLGELTPAGQELIAVKLLADAVTDDYAINTLLQRSRGEYWS
ncbi:MAG TPA: hypothetical protein PLO28_15210, partial [bacterium]|nr:hypothetical protein [bacterium]